ncbi:MAG: HEPN domain-containing protein [Aestuariivita sp.]|nr:HEPN domain-containing protein [Aestuariivita sp.]
MAVKSRLTVLERQIDLSCSTKDAEVASNLRCFGAVLICGFVERSVEVVLLERLRDRAHPSVLKFVRSHLVRGRNYNCDNILQLLYRFDSKWGRNFDNFKKNHEKEAQALASMYSVRNSVAHGNTADISEVKIKGWLEDAKKIIDALIFATQQ